MIRLAWNDIEVKHGWAIAKRTQQISNEVLQVQQGSLYPALHRLSSKGGSRPKWSETGTGRPAKFYSLAAARRAQLERDMESRIAGRYVKLPGLVKVVSGSGASISVPGCTDINSLQPHRTINGSEHWLQSKQATNEKNEQSSLVY